MEYRKKDRGKFDKNDNNQNVKRIRHENPDDSLINNRYDKNTSNEIINGDQDLNYLNDIDIDSGKNITSDLMNFDADENDDTSKNLIKDTSSQNIPEINFETHKKIVKNRKNKYFFRAIWIVLLTFISVLIASYAIVGMNDMLGIMEGNDPVSVEIPKGANLETVAKILKDRGIIRQKGFFKLYSIVTKNSKGILSGSYELRPNMDYQAILNNLRNNDSNREVIEIAFIEGMNIQECASILEEKGVCEKDKFLEKCNSNDFDEKYDFLKNVSNNNARYYKLEGYLFPDTYEFYLGEDPSNVIRRFLSNFQKKTIKMNSLKGYDKKTSVKQLSEEAGKTLDTIIIISSLIQAEAANKDDMYKVSSVIYNRLGITPPDGKTKFGEFGLTRLGIDSTVWYPYKTREAVPSNIVENFKSSYNTYDIIGLPPGAICNPGMDAIYAALKPEKTDYFYFCHSALGDAYYAKTNDAHLSNLKKAGIA